MSELEFRPVVALSLLIALLIEANLFIKKLANTC